VRHHLDTALQSLEHSGLTVTTHCSQPSSASIASTIFNYRKLHGRTFHNFQTGDLQYW
jgi:hypothetical protein